MSILTFNNFDFGLMFAKVQEDDKQSRMHQSKFLKQCAYNVVIVTVNLGLTIWTAVTMTDIEYNMETASNIACSALNLTIVNGTETRLISTTNTGWMLGSGWLFFLASLLLNLVYYLIHPSSPEMWIWGKAEELEEWKPEEASEESDINQGTESLPLTPLNHSVIKED